MEHLVCSAATAGGIGRHTVGVSKSLDDAGNHVHVVVPSTNVHQDTYSQEQIGTTTVPAKIGNVRLDNPDHVFAYALLYTMVMVMSFIKHRSPVLYCTSWFPCGLIGALLSVPFDLRLVLVAHGGEISTEVGGGTLGTVVASLQRWVFDRADDVFAVSEFTASRLETVGIQSSFVCENGVDPDRFEDAPEVDVHTEYDLDGEDSSMLLTVSRLKEHKGHETIVRALPQVTEQHPEVTYAIAGTGDEEYATRLREVASELGVSENVAFLGYVPDDHLPALYRSSDMYIMPSYAGPEGVEGFGISYLEAGVCGTPCIGTTSGGAASIIDDGLNGFLVEPHNSDMLASRIERLLTDSKMKSEMGSRNRKIVLENYTWNRIVDGMLNTLHGSEYQCKK